MDIFITFMPFLVPLIAGMNIAIFFVVMPGLNKLETKLGTTAEVIKSIHQSQEGSIRELMDLIKILITELSIKRGLK